jgi:gamma-glutamyltranspeptidase/glutathione hydrolase
VLGEIAAGGADAFYRGRAAEAIGAAVERAGGPLRAADLAEWGGARWVQPLRARFRDVDVLQLPPPGQGIIALEALGILDGLETASAADAEHASIEAIKLAFADAARYVADPDFSPVPVETLLSERYLAGRRAEIDMGAAREASAGSVSDTVYVAVADGDGGTCSFIQSLYEGFGSGIAAGGIVLHNRGSGFVLEAGHANRPEPRKRPYHTIIPAMVARGDEFMGCLGVVGGFMQPQGQVQILRNVLDRGMGLQAALDAPRARFVAGRQVLLEPGYDADVAGELRRRGHELGELTRFQAGGAQAVFRIDGLLHGASDPRKDGMALAG